MKKIIALCICLLGFSLNLLAQSNVSQSGVEMADGLRTSGKIYVVVAVLLTILIGLFVYLMKLDGKLGKIEKELKINR